jgi:UDP-N-acetyl-D-galactosamine dehydrogenase
VSLIKQDDIRLAVIGLGYVGLPLAVAFGRQRDTLGFDIRADRIAALEKGHDATREVEPELLAAATQLRYSSDPADLSSRNVFVVSVPTPIDSARRPDLTALRRASETVGRALTPGAVVVYESTVYPGATEEECVPVLEAVSGLKYNRDFFVGYSPERINPGDKEHRLENIVKVTSGSTPECAELVDNLYASVVTAGTHLASSIKVAEAAKVIENTQRDLNIALINELAQIFNRLQIDTREVLEAAGTKWNFLPFKPGLVGGHCIGVDPYYLTYKAEEVGHNPEVILAGRRINDRMGAWVAHNAMKLASGRGVPLAGGRALVLGLSFKENCPDIRNTRAIDIVRELADWGMEVDVHDPWVEPDEAAEEFGLSLVSALQAGTYGVVVLAVAHREFAAWQEAQLRELLAERGVIVDVKGCWPREWSDMRL